MLECYITHFYIFLFSSGPLFPNLKVVMPVDIFDTTPENLGFCGPGDGITSHDMRIDSALTDEACKMDEFWDIYMVMCFI